MNKLHLKHKKNTNIINRIIIIIIFVIIFSIYFLVKLNNKVTPLFIEYSEVKVKKLASTIITNSINEEIESILNNTDLFITSKDTNGNINTIDIKSNEVNNILSKISKIVEDNLKTLENTSEEDIKDSKQVFLIPSGIIFNNSIFYNILPKIPVKLKIMGNTLCKLNTDIKSYGINNSLLTVSIDVSVDIKILLPYTYKLSTFDVSVPIIIKVIEGSVPSYYLNGYMNTPYTESKN